MAAPPVSLENAALLILDVQNDFLLPHGALPVVNGPAIIPTIVALRSHFPLHRVVHTQDWHPANHISFSSRYPGVPLFTTVPLPRWQQLVVPAHCVQNTTGADFHDAFKPLPSGCHVVRKGGDAEVESHSAFHDIVGGCTGLYPLLKAGGTDRVVICGVHTDVLIEKTVADALRLFPRPGAVVVVADAIAGFVPERCPAAIAAMERNGALFVRSAEILAR